MVQYEKQELPDSGGTGYYITDDYGHTAQLSAEPADDLLEWLNEQLPVQQSQGLQSKQRLDNTIDATELHQRMREDWSNDE